MSFLGKVATGAGVFLGGTIPKQTENNEDYQIETSQQQQDIQNEVNNFNNQNEENLKSTKEAVTESQQEADKSDNDLKREYEEKREQ